MIDCTNHTFCLRLKELFFVDHMVGIFEALLEMNFQYQVTILLHLHYLRPKISHFKLSGIFSNLCSEKLFTFVFLSPMEPAIADFANDV